MDMNEIEMMLNAQNHLPLEQFEGYSPEEMNYILYATLEPGSPVRINKLPDAEYSKIPIMNQVKYLMGLIAKSGELKLTSKGFLPTKVVQELYAQGFMTDYLIESGMYKLYKETDSKAINLTRILLELSGLVKKRHGKLSLTKASEKMLSNNDQLLRTILNTFTKKFNWGYYDSYNSEPIGALGYGFTLILLAKYGHEQQHSDFYAEKYFDAYPALIDTISSTYAPPLHVGFNCYDIRTFERFLRYFGVIDIEYSDGGILADRFITKSALFDKLITITPPQMRVRFN